MAQNRRQAAINGFRDGKFDILVATDIAARGIDVTEISHVINFDMPDTVDAYTHRIGRTGRAHQTGEAFTFSVDDDAPMVREIERVLGMQIERRQMEDFDYLGYVPGQAQPGQSSSKRGNSNRSNRRRRSSSNSNQSNGNNSNGSQSQSGSNGSSTSSGSSQSNGSKTIGQQQWLQALAPSSLSQAQEFLAGQ